MADPHPTFQNGANGIGTMKKDFFDDSIPDKLVTDKDFISLYLRCRYDRRDKFEPGQSDGSRTEKPDKFKAGLPESLRLDLPDDYEDKIKLELSRIAELRAIFFGKERNSADITKLKELKVAWKQAAIDSFRANSNANESWMRHLGEEEENLKQESEAIKNQSTSAKQRKQRRPEEIEKSIKMNIENIRRAKNKDRVLQAVETWVRPGDGVDEEHKKDVSDDSGYGFVVSKILLKKGEGSSFDQYEREGYSVEELLENNAKKDPWKAEDTEHIRYFHFPANNMKWIEKAIRKHYNETEEEQPQTSKILSRELWTGQQHGAPNDPLHARHMRSHYPEVDDITAEHHHTPQKRSNNNIILFMPYLHWEMDRKRAHMTNLTKKLTAEYQKQQTRHHIRHTGKLADIVREYKKEFSFLHEPKAKEAKEAVGPDASALSDDASRKPRFCGLFKPNIKTDGDQSASKKGAKACGLFLMQAAKVYEAMELEPDTKLVHSYLHYQPPFHPRRTLDQSYYFKLENTEFRDRDQVVYRGTKEGRKIHGSTRVIMVDQLWMYILDENTIITSFPRRLGRNKPDSSGVHRCIRHRLDNLRPGEINSVYDLALLIMNECSMVFFDRTKPIDERPEVLDLFANAIGSISQMKTTAFELFWRHLQILSGQSLKIDPEKARIYLNINPEGLLLREAHDIVEELIMMSRICMQQLQVTEIFSKSLETISGQVEPLQEITGLLSLVLQELQKKNSPNPNNRVIDSTSPTEPMITNIKKATMKPTIDRSLVLVDTISNHHKELHQLEASAREIAGQLRDLLTLKQQQASIIEATAALGRADESVHQGRSIMIFTIITIIFLPLSFMSSIFGMNAVEFTGPSNSVMGIGEQFKVMFPISIALTLFFLYLALKTPSPTLLKLPKWIYFLVVITRSSYYGFTGQTNKWNKLYTYMNSGPAKNKLPKKDREKVEIAYRNCTAFKAKLKMRHNDSDNKKPEATTDDSHEWLNKDDGSPNGEHNV